MEVESTIAELRPEMTARLEILVGERPDVLLVPVNAIFERDGVSVAYVLRGRRVESRLVELGEANEFDVEVIAGLREGERISLSDTGAADASSASEAMPQPLAGRE